MTDRNLLRAQLLIEAADILNESIASQYNEAKTATSIIMKLKKGESVSIYDAINSGAFDNSTFRQHVIINLPNNYDEVITNICKYFPTIHKNLYDNLGSYTDSLSDKLKSYSNKASTLDKAEFSNLENKAYETGLRMTATFISQFEKIMNSSLDIIKNKFPFDELEKIKSSMITDTQNRKSLMRAKSAIGYGFHMYVEPVSAAYFDTLRKSFGFKDKTDKQIILDLYEDRNESYDNPDLECFPIGSSYDNFLKYVYNVGKLNKASLKQVFFRN